MNPEAVPIALQSSLLSSAAYSDDGTLQLQFHNGAIYQYFAVPIGVFQDLLAAQSKGSYFNRYISDPFQHQRLA